MDKLYSWLEKMAVNVPAATEFERGFYTALLLAAAVFFLLFVLCLILKLLFRKPAIPGITLEREDGNIFISRNAVFTAVSRLEYEFPELEILKVTMVRNRRRELGLNITVLFDERDNSFDAVAGALKQRTFTMLNKSFGIDSVKSVAINLAKIPAGRDVDEDDSSKNVQPVSNTFVSGI